MKRLLVVKIFLFLGITIPLSWRVVRFVISNNLLNHLDLSTGWMLLILAPGISVMLAYFLTAYLYYATRQLPFFKSLKNMTLLAILLYATYGFLLYRSERMRLDAIDQERQLLQAAEAEHVWFEENNYFPDPSYKPSINFRPYHHERTASNGKKVMYACGTTKYPTTIVYTPLEKIVEPSPSPPIIILPKTAPTPTPDADKLINTQLLIHDLPATYVATKDDERRSITFQTEKSEISSYFSDDCALSKDEIIKLAESMR